MDGVIPDDPFYQFDRPALPDEQSQTFGNDYPETPMGEGGGAGGFAAAQESGIAFEITDTTEDGIETFSVGPGKIEILNGGFSTFVTPSNLDTDISAVTGVVYLAVTLSSGVPVSAVVENAAALPSDTGTLAHVQIGTITVGTSEVTVDSQDVRSNVLFSVRNLSPLSLYFVGSGETLKVRITYGTIDGEVPPQVQGGSSPSDASPIAAKYWAKSEYDADGKTGVVSIAGGASVPADTTTATHRLIGEVQIISDVPTIFQNASGSLESFKCGDEDSTNYSWGSI